MSNESKILIIAPAWIGDMVMSQSLLKLLYQQHAKQLTIDVFANNWASGLLSRMSEVHDIIINPFVHGKLDLLGRIKVGFQLRKNFYDQVFILPNSFKSAITPLFASIKTRTGFVGEGRYPLLNDVYKLDQKQLPLMVDRFCALANQGKKVEAIEWPQLMVDIDNQQHLLQKFGLNSEEPLVAFCPAAEYGPSKRWLPEHFAQLSDSLTQNGYTVMLFGSDKDIAISTTIINLVKNKRRIIDLCGKTSLIDAVDLLAKSKYVVTNDSGLMHIAAAVGTQVIAVYGSSSPDFTPPLSNSAQILRIKLDCSPCFARTCRFDHYNCLRFITPAMVFAKILTK